MTWFLAALFGVFAPAALLARAAPKAIPSRRLVFYGSGIVLAAAGTWILTELLGDFVFTWPAGIFLALLLALEVRAWALRDPDRRKRIAARAALALLVILLASYWWLCRGLFLVAGLSYLAGLLPTMPVAVWTVGTTQRKGLTLLSLGLGLVAFCVFFWSSASVLWWKNG